MDKFLCDNGLGHERVKKHFPNMFLNTSLDFISELITGTMIDNTENKIENLQLQELRNRSFQKLVILLVTHTKQRQ